MLIIQVEKKNEKDFGSAGVSASVAFLAGIKQIRPDSVYLFYIKYTNQCKVVSLQTEQQFFQEHVS